MQLGRRAEALLAIEEVDRLAPAERVDLHQLAERARKQLRPR